MIAIKQMREGNNLDYMIQKDNSQAAFRIGDATNAFLTGTAGNAKPATFTSRFWILTEETRIESVNGSMTQVGYKGDYLVELNTGGNKVMVIMRKEHFEATMQQV